MNLFRLNRPQYFGTPEVVLSSLAWSLANHGEEGIPRRAFEVCSGENTAGRKDSVTVTRSKLVQGAEKIVREHVHRPFNASSLVGPLLDGLQGVTPSKGHYIPAVPLTKSAAFLQGIPGGYKNPPNFAAIVERFFQLGSDEPVGEREAAHLWFEALSAEETQEPFKCIEEIASGSAPPADYADGGQPMAKRPRWLEGLRTPFGWFHRAWRCYCEAGWRDAMPRRRWSDWGCCLVRTAFGMAFLWEAEFYEWLRNKVLDRDPGAPPGGVGNESVLAWHDPDATLTARDVNSLITRKLTRGESSRRAIETILDGVEQNLDELDLDGLVQLLRRKAAEAGDANPLSQPPSAGSSVNNLKETVVYSLQCRAENGSEADFYSLLRRRSRRFLVVEPGPEWIVVVASMAAGGPGRSTTAGSIAGELRSLGLEAKRENVIGLLEAAGLSRSSHDADLALEVAPAF